MLKKIEKPDIYNIKNEEIWKRLSPESPYQKDLLSLLDKSSSPYVYWDKVKHWRMPSGMRPEELWSFIKFSRKVSSRHSSVIQDVDGLPFTWIRSLPEMDEILHRIDLQLGGSLFDFGSHWDERQRHQLLNRGVMEEAIASSQLEGAHTTRRAAQRMLQEGRPPRTKDEIMIFNNYEAMQWIQSELRNRELDYDQLINLHKILTKDSLDPEEIGRLRRDEDEIVVGDSGTGEVSFEPPPEVFLQEQLGRFFAYANDRSPEPQFIHPVLKAISLHFWIGFLHPFVDGNGRMARAIFYWYLLRKNYGTFGYLPLSSVIKKSPVQYRDAYVYAEQDDRDLTYFLDYNLRKIHQAMQEFETYVRRKGKENFRMAQKARGKYALNDRQIQLLRFLHKNPDATTSVTRYVKLNQVALMTARKDLLDLKKMGLLDSRKSGRIVDYFSTEKLGELFNP